MYHFEYEASQPVVYMCFRVHDLYALFPMTSPPIVLIRLAQNNKEDNVYLQENIDSIHKNNKYWRTLMYGISFLKFSCYVQSVDELMCNTKKNIERGSGVDKKIDFWNRCSDGR
jgi:hypothetical protein